MQLGNSWTIASVYACFANIFNLRFIHKKTLKSEPLRVVEHCAYTFKLSLLSSVLGVKMQCNSNSENSMQGPISRMKDLTPPSSSFIEVEVRVSLVSRDLLP